MKNEAEAVSLCDRCGWRCRIDPRGRKEWRRTREKRKKSCYRSFFLSLSLFFLSRSTLFGFFLFFSLYPAFSFFLLDSTRLALKLDDEYTVIQHVPHYSQTHTLLHCTATHPTTVFNHLHNYDANRYTASHCCSSQSFGAL